MAGALDHLMMGGFRIAAIHTLEEAVMKLAFRTLELALGLVFLGAVAHHVATLDFRPLAAFALPILVVYFGFASLQLSRSKAVSRRRAAASREAADRAVQATTWHLVGIILGTSLYAVVSHFDLAGAWLAVFAAPYALMQIGLLAFLRGIWAVAPQTLTFPRW
jgi:hypothetical protein